jgi:hypothetical protein
MDAVIDTQAAEERRGSAEIVRLDDYRRVRGLAPARRPEDDADPFPWAYTFPPPRSAS